MPRQEERRTDDNFQMDHTQPDTPDKAHTNGTATAPPRDRKTILKARQRPPKVRHDFAAIPAELKPLWRWVCWKYEWVNDGWSKVPYDAGNGRKAKNNDKTTWADLRYCLLHAGDNPRVYDGVGVMFGLEGEGPYAGVDLDDCRDPDTGEVKAWARAILDRLRSYTDISPTDTGLKVIVRAEKPDWVEKGKKKFRCGDGTVELFFYGCYFTVTGRCLADYPTTIEQADLGALRAELIPAPEEPERTPPPRLHLPLDLSDQQLLDKARRAKNGPKFRALFDAGDTGGYPSHSEADAALCFLLCFWAGRDPTRIDVLFRQSGLMRPKWDRQDYRDATIERAVEKVQETYPERVARRREERRARPGKGKDLSNTGDAAASVILDHKSGYEVILDFFREHYRPLFKRGTTLYSEALGREVARSEACYAAGAELIDLLMVAHDAPTNKSGGRDRNAMPYFFRNWAPSAWVDMLKGVEEEEKTAEMSDAPAQEFRGRVAAGLFSQATYGVDVERDGHKEKEQQRRTLLQWCGLWAKPAGWGQVRSALLWSRKDDEGRLCVALRVELFGQFGPRELAGLSQRKFADLAELYGVGEAQRACHRRVVVLSQEFVSELLTGPSSDGDGGTGTDLARARTREECVPASPDEDLP